MTDLAYVKARELELCHRCWSEPVAVAVTPDLPVSRILVCETVAGKGGRVMRMGRV